MRVIGDGKWHSALHSALHFALHSARVALLCTLHCPTPSDLELVQQVQVEGELLHPAEEVCTSCSCVRLSAPASSWLGTARHSAGQHRAAFNVMAHESLTLLLDSF